MSCSAGSAASVAMAVTRLGLASAADLSLELSLALSLSLVLVLRRRVTLELLAASTSEADATLAFVTASTASLGLTWSGTRRRSSLVLLDEDVELVVLIVELLVVLVGVLTLANLDLSDALWRAAGVSTTRKLSRLTVLSRSAVADGTAGVNERRSSSTVACWSETVARYHAASSLEAAAAGDGATGKRSRSSVAGNTDVARVASEAC